MLTGGRAFPSSRRRATCRVEKRSAFHHMLRINYLCCGGMRCAFPPYLPWHDGEAQAARLGFEAPTTDQRNDVLLFLGSL